MPDAESAPLSPRRSSLRFGPEGRFELQPAESRLLVDGKPSGLGSRALDLLIALTAQPGQLITKSELLDRVWPGLVVEEGNLHVQISNLRRLIGGDAIATVPGRGYRFSAELLAPVAPGGDAAAAAMTTAPTPAKAPPPAAPAPGAAPSLPVVGGRLIGRDIDLAGLERALAAPGCVTLVGAGGVGKTRLALAAAKAWPGRQVWVDLAPLTEGVQIAGALARALGLPLADGDAEPQLVSALGEEPVLLVLDNAEHLVEPSCALASALLAGAARLHLLVTSQLPLGLAGEQVLRIESLAIEPVGSTPAGEGDGAIALLVARIASADHRVRLDAGSTPLLREICRELDALPLALEMAAARVPLLGLKGVHDELSERFALLTTGHRHAAQRHRTLHAALDWSFKLLGAEEQRLFATLGVFAGGFSLDLCVALAGDEAGSRWDVIDRLATLVDRSLVAASHDDPPRYRLLETMRAYALEKLRDSDEEARLRQRHAEVVRAFFARRTAEFRDHPHCIPELENVRAAQAWMQAQRPPPAPAIMDLSMLASLPTTFTPWRGQTHAWMLALEPWMSSAEAEACDLRQRLAWWIEYTRSSANALSNRALAIAEKTLVLARANNEAWPLCRALGAVLRVTRTADAELDARATEVRALLQAHPEWSARYRLAIQGALAIVADLQGDWEALLAARREEALLARAVGNHAAADAAETNVVAALDKAGRWDEALALACELTDRLEGQPTANLCWAWDGRLTLLLDLNRLDEARRHLPHFAVVCREFDMLLASGLMLNLAWRSGRPEAAARLLGHMRQEHDQRGETPYDLDNLVAEILDDIVPRLDGRLEALVQAGRGLSEAEALALACEPGPPAPASTVPA